MKYKTTKKDIKSRHTVYSIGNGEIQQLLNYCEPFAYSTRAEGWACDYYLIHGIVFCSGYAPFGIKVDHKLLRKYETKARRFLDKASWSKSNNYKRTILLRWLGQLIDEITKNK